MNQQVKEILKSYLSGTSLSEEQIALLKQELTPDTVNNYVPFHLIPKYITKMRNLHTYNNSTIHLLSMEESVLLCYEVLGLYFNCPEMRTGTLHFDSVPNIHLNQYFLHTARPHPLRQDIIKGPPKLLTGEQLDLDEVKRLAWVDTDLENTYSGLLVFLLHSKNGQVSGGVAQINTIQTEYQMFFGDMVWKKHGETDTCHVHSLLIRPGDDYKHQHLIRAGMLSTFADLTKISTDKSALLKQ